jgi:hypothetical protein
LLADGAPVERPFAAGRRPRRDDAADFFAFFDGDDEDFLTLGNADRNPTLFAIGMPLIRLLHDLAFEYAHGIRKN